MRRFIMTNHATFLAVEHDELIQVHSSNNADFIEIDLPESDSIVIEDGPLSGFRCKSEGGNAISLAKDGNYLCAGEQVRALSANRPERYDWETFFLVDRVQFERLKGFNLGEEAEKARFAHRVEELAALGVPVKVYCGCGRIPRDGYINLDIRIFAPSFAAENSDDYYLFSFADSPWPLADDSVDFVFDEDFIEHIDQLTQIQYLAETRRVLKPDCYHRVNTPNLITAFKRHSDFEKGIAGVYTGEREHGHIAMFSPWSLKEMADLVGYREVVFETRDISVSPYKVKDYRPWADRDTVLGNIYAELLK
jgi:predicted SAM-dependent methyltransferase